MPPPYGPHVHAWILKYHPQLVDAGYEPKSDDTGRYNCIAWAADDLFNVWWPTMGGYWPQGAQSNDGLVVFVTAFRALGFEPCGLDGSLEPGFVKVAVYVGADNRTKHMARQLADGRWTSKLGDGWDIEHNALSGLEDDRYGKVAAVLKKPTSA